MAITRKLRSFTPTPVGGESFENATHAQMPDGVTSTTTDSGVVVTDVGTPSSLEPVPAGILVEQTLAGPGGAHVVALPTNPYGPDSGLQGEWSQDDVRLPSVKIVQGSGELSKIFTLGSVIFGDEEFLQSPDIRAARPADFFRFVPVVIRKQFRENLSQAEVAAGQMARIVNHAHEMEALGGHIDWRDGQKPPWSPSATVIMLIEKPAEGIGAEHPNFVIEIGDKLFAPAVFYASGSGFNSLAKVIFNSAQTVLTVPDKDAQGQILRTASGVIRRVPYLPKHYWTWRTVRKPSGDYTVFAPEVRLHKEETSEELRERVAIFRS